MRFLIVTTNIIDPYFTVKEFSLQCSSLRWYIHYDVIEPYFTVKAFRLQCNPQLSDDIHCIYLFH